MYAIVKGLKVIFYYSIIKNMKKLKINIFLFNILLFQIILNSWLPAQSIGFQKRPGGYLIGGQATFDIYKPYCSFYVNLKRNERPTTIQSGDELDIYSRLGTRLYLPKFILFQTTFYQLSTLSSYLETNHPQIFNKFNTYYGLNIIRSIGAGYEEPYAFSLFLGNIILLSYDKSNKNKNELYKQSGSALAGFLLSTGNHQISDNIYINDQWYQYELMFVGDLKEQKIRKISWNFRLGIKYHSNRILRDIFLLAIERSHSTWQKTGFSLFKNSIFKYKSYVPTSFKDNPPPVVYQCFSYGKKIPINIFKKNIFLIIAGGVSWEWVYHYDRNTKKFESKPSGSLVWLFQPNIEF